MRAIEIVDGIAWWAISRRKGIDGLTIGVWDGDHDAEIFDKITKALAFIETHDPLRYKRLLRDLERVWVLLLPGDPGCFHVENWCCRLDCRLVLSSPIEEIASIIVHEATHARLFRRGIGYQEAMRARVEKVCIRRQAAFLARSSYGDASKPTIDGYLALDTSTWTDEAFGKRKVRGTVAALRHLGSPDWLISAVLRSHRRRMRRRRQRPT